MKCSIFKSYIIISLVFIIVFICLMIFMVGNPQWHKSIFIFQVYWLKYKRAAITPNNYSGIWRKWSKKGQLILKIEYKHGLKHGLYEEFNEQGVLIARSYWQNGKRNGTSKVWRNDGTLIESINYKDGKIDGRWVCYSEDGLTEIFNCIFRDDKPWKGTLVILSKKDGFSLNNYQNGIIVSHRVILKNSSAKNPKETSKNPNLTNE